MNERLVSGTRDDGLNVRIWVMFPAGTQVRSLPPLIPGVWPGYCE